MSHVKKAQLNEALKTIGGQIRELRHSTGMSQEVFGEKCGWDRTRQCKIESGKQNLTMGTLIIIGNTAKMKTGVSFTK